MGTHEGMGKMERMVKHEGIGKTKDGENEGMWKRKDREEWTSGNKIARMGKLKAWET